MRDGRRKKEPQKPTELYLITVMPLTRSAGKETLSYFTARTDIVPGTVVSAPLQKKQVLGIVTERERARTSRAALRRASFSIRKIVSPPASHPLSEAFIESARETAAYFGTTTGALLSRGVARALFSVSRAETAPTRSQHTEPFCEAVHAPLPERRDAYRKVIRTMHAENRSVFLCASTAEEVKGWAESLSSEIPCVIALHGELKGPAAKKALVSALRSPGPILIVATGSFLAIPREDLGLIIVEREHAGSFRTIGTPAFDFRFLIRTYAKKQGLSIVWGSFPFSFETYAEVIEPTCRLRPARTLRKPHTISIIDMRKKKEGQQFELFSPELLKRLRELPPHERLFLFAVRKGLAGTTVCGDCGAPLVSRAGNPMVLYQNAKRERVFVCPVSGEVKGARTKCESCGGWNLRALGIGIDRIAEELARQGTAERRTFILDMNHAKTPRAAKHLVEEWQKTPGGILVGTEMALLYLPHTFSHAVVVSADSLLSLPEWKAQEKFFTIIATLAAKAEHSLIIQSRDPEHPLLGAAARQETAALYEHERETRRQFLYPPYGVLIKISFSGAPGRVEAETERLLNIFAAFRPRSYEARRQPSAGARLTHLLMKLPAHAWPDEKLLELVRALPPYLRVEVNPEQLL